MLRYWFECLFSVTLLPGTSSRPRPREQRYVHGGAGSARASLSVRHHIVPETFCDVRPGVYAD
jgi:hypothetical protein